MQRAASGIDFRANITGGGSAKKFNPSKHIKEIAIKSIQALGLNYGGVDIIMVKNKPMVIEVNSCPGTQIEKITKIKVSKEIIKNLTQDL